MGKAGNRWIATVALAALLSSTGSAVGDEKSAESTGKAEEVTPKAGEVMVLSLQESILLGLKNNLAIAIEGFNPKIRAADVTAAKAVFDPTAFAEVNFASTREKNRSALAGVATSQNEDLDFNAGLRQDLPTGGSYELRFDNNRNFNNAAFFANLGNETAYASELSLTLTQPFLKNFGVDINRTQITVAQNEREISLDRLRETTMDVITDVQAAYWDLVFALENLKVQERSLRLARELAEVNRARVRAGVAAPVEITQAEAEIAAREAGVTVAEKRVRDAEDRLKIVLNIPKQGEWGGAVLPSDPARFSPVTPDLPGAVADALRMRPEYEAAKVDLSNRELTLRFTRNQLLPDLSFRGSVGLNGLDATNPSYGDNLNELGSRDFYSYSAGLVFSIPLGNRAARAEFIKAQFEREQARVSLRSLELEITAEVREAVRRVQADAKLVEETRATRVLREEQLRIEQKRLEAGVSTTFEVLRFQRDLAVAQSAEVRTVTDHKKAVANLDRVRGVALEKHRIQM
ncbi:MAG: TolC family protein [candidate division NC10 bacterium]|nr:TolC family protein [candidate division NC10 bacterium]